jgi:hypothetical protein
MATANPKATSTTTTKPEIHHWYSRSSPTKSRAMIAAETRPRTRELPSRSSPISHRTKAPAMAWATIAFARSTATTLHHRAFRLSNVHPTRSVTLRANFREFSKSEVRRIPIPRTWVNRSPPPAQQANGYFTNESRSPLRPRPCLATTWATLSKRVYSPQ